MFKKKKIEVKINKTEELKTFLKTKTPTLFDRHPVLTGNLDKFVNEILEIVG